MEKLARGLKVRGLSFVIVWILSILTLVTTARAANVSLAWDPSVSSNVAGYKLYYGRSSGFYQDTINTGSATSATVPNLAEGATYYFAVTCFDNEGSESAFSNEIVYTVPAKAPATKPVAPFVTITEPSNGSSIPDTASFTIAAAVTANAHVINKVQLYVGSSLLAEDTTAPYSWTASGATAGSHVLTVRAVYDGGYVVASAPVTVNVYRALPPPTVSLASPANGATYQAPASLNLIANVTANGNTIDKVQFFNGSVLLGEDFNAPYSLIFLNAGAGVFEFSARAIYNGGSESVNSAAATINVVPSAPTVYLAASSPSGPFTAPATVSLNATVNPNGNTITKVQFWSGKTLVAEDFSWPYTHNWTGVQAGDYSVFARVFYGASANITSAILSINVADGGLPAPWETADIGAIYYPGDASFASGESTVKGAGDIGGSSDSFRYLYQTLSGDGEIIAKVNSVKGLVSGGAAGIMVRENLSPSARFAFLGTNPKGAFQGWMRRSTGSATSSYLYDSGAVVPVGPDGALLPNFWVKLVRTGDLVQFYFSRDASTWSRWFYFTESLPENILVGLATASGNAYPATAEFSSVAVKP